MGKAGVSFTLTYGVKTVDSYSSNIPKVVKTMWDRACAMEMPRFEENSFAHITAYSALLGSYLKLKECRDLSDNDCALLCKFFDPRNDTNDEIVSPFLHCSYWPSIERVAVELSLELAVFRAGGDVVKVAMKEFGILKREAAFAVMVTSHIENDWCCSYSGDSRFDAIRHIGLCVSKLTGRDEARFKRFTRLFWAFCVDEHTLRNAVPIPSYSTDSNGEPEWGFGSLIVWIMDERLSKRELTTCFELLRGDGHICSVFELHALCPHPKNIMMRLEIAYLASSMKRVYGFDIDFFAGVWPDSELPKSLEIVKSLSLMEPDKQEELLRGIYAIFKDSNDFSILADALKMLNNPVVKKARV